MVVLLKTASVRVSFIQIMQVRVQNKGKSVWKSRYVGDVSLGHVVNRTCIPRLSSPCLFGEGCGLVFGLICRFVPSTWWSVWLIFLIVFQQHWLKGFVIKLRQQLALRVTFDRLLVAVFFSGQDLSPPFIECICSALRCCCLFF